MIKRSIFLYSALPHEDGEISPMIVVNSGGKFLKSAGIGIDRVLSASGHAGSLSSFFVAKSWNTTSTWLVMPKQLSKRHESYIALSVEYLAFPGTSGEFYPGTDNRQYHGCFCKASIGQHTHKSVTTPHIFLSSPSQSCMNDREMTKNESVTPTS